MEWTYGGRTFSLADVVAIDIAIVPPAYLWGIFWAALSILAGSAVVVLFVRRASPTAGVMCCVVTVALVHAALEDARHGDKITLLVHLKSRAGLPVRIVVRDELEASRVQNVLLEARERMISLRNV